MSAIWKILTRKKVIDPSTVAHSELNRVLNWFDLTTLGVGSTLGVGAYVLVGQVAKETAGPSVILSFLIAAIASVFAGLCYAEFGARAPRAGSAYIYSYICIGEFVAFIIGWNLILEYIIGSASVARGLSQYLDTLLNNTLNETFREIAPIDISYMSTYFDFLAFGVSFLLAVAIAFGIKESAIVNNILTIVNVSVIIFIIIAGSLKADSKNWSLSPLANSTIAGEGGFFPWGIEGMIRGAATCFYGFIGFDVIATTGEEVKNPQKALPLSIILSLFIVFLAYFGTSTVITLMVPYYLQDTIPHAFEIVGWDVAKWIIAIGAIFGLFASLFGALFPLPRIIYAMASDGLIFRFLGIVNRRFKSPIIGTVLAGIFTGLMGALFEVKHLVAMMSIGTLMAYTIVAASVLLLRYERDTIQSESSQSIQNNSDSESTDEYTDNSPLDDQQPIISDVSFDERITASKVMKQIFNCSSNSGPTEVSERIVTVQVGIYCVLCIFLGLIAKFLSDEISKLEIWAVVIAVIVLSLTIIVIMSIATQPKSQKELAFKVPLVPLIPALSILVNIYLMLMLDNQTWIRFAIWMAIGESFVSIAINLALLSNACCKYLHGYSLTLGLPIYCISACASKKTSYKNGNLNGYSNAAFQDDDKNARQISQEKIESTIAVLDEVIDNEASKLKRLSFDENSINNKNAFVEENVVAFVHVNNNACSSVFTNHVDEQMQTLNNVRTNQTDEQKLNELRDEFSDDGREFLIISSNNVTLADDNREKLVLDNFENNESQTDDENDRTSPELEEHGSGVEDGDRVVEKHDPVKGGSKSEDTYKVIEPESKIEKNKEVELKNVEPDLKLEQKKADPELKIIEPESNFELKNVEPDSNFELKNVESDSNFALKNDEPDSNVEPDSNDEPDSNVEPDSNLELKNVEPDSNLELNNVGPEPNLEQRNIEAESNVEPEPNLEQKNIEPEFERQNIKLELKVEEKNDIVEPPNTPVEEPHNTPTDIRVALPILDRNVLNNIKLKRVQSTPESSALSLRNDFFNKDYPSSDNLKFGSAEYQSFRDRLNENLLKTAVIPKEPTQPTPVTTNKPVIIETQHSEPNENVVEEKFDRRSAMDVVNRFLSTSPKGFSRDSFKEIYNTHQQPQNKPLEQIKEPETDKDNDESVAEDKVVHRQNMGDIFKSIRLIRKTDSFKNEEIS